MTGTVAAFGFSQHVFTAPRAGQLSVVLTWSNAAIDLDLYLTDSSCNSYPPLHCPSRTSSAATSGTSETITRTVVSGEQLKFWADNFHETLSSEYSIQLKIQ